MTRIFDEKFEATGYDETWANGETVGSGNTLDEDADPSDVGSPSGWGTKSLQSECFNINPSAYVEETGHSAGISYVRVEFVLVSMSNFQNFAFFRAETTTGNLYDLRITKGSGSPVLSIRSYHDGSVNNYNALGSISFNTRYRVEARWDAAANEWEWRLDDVAQPNDVDASDPITSAGTLTGGHATSLQNFAVGITGFTESDIYFDLFAIDDTDWVGAEVNTYEVSLADGADFGDVPINVMTRLGAVVDGAEFGDSSINIATLLSALTDGIVLGDSPTNIATLFSAILDGIEFGDVVINIAIKEGAVIDGVDFGDVPINIATLFSALTDGTKFGDVTINIATKEASLIDGILLGDSSLITVILSTSIVDGVLFGDTNVGGGSFSVSIADGVEFGDITIGTGIFNVEVADGITLGDILTAAGVITGMTVTFTAKTAQIEFTVKTPSPVFTVKSP